MVILALFKNVKRCRKQQHYFFELVTWQTAQEYEAQYDFARGDTYSQFHGYAYDAIWTVAATIKSVVHKLHERNKLLSGNSGRSSSIQQRPATGGTGSSSSTRSSQQHWTLNDFIYRDPGWEKLFLDALRSVNINGVTVRRKKKEIRKSHYPNDNNKDKTYIKTNHTQAH